MSKTTLPITGLTVGAIPAAVLVCGDPNRASQIAGHLAKSSLLSEQRGYMCYRGLYNAWPVAVCSHGVGAPGAAVVFEELIAAGAKTIIRIGTCGGLQPELAAGQLVVARAAVDNTGYGPQTVPAGYPAVADPGLTLRLHQEASQITGRRVTEGIVLTRDNFYRGVDLPHLVNYEIMTQANVLAVEMECSALFMIGTLRQILTGAILVVDGNLVAAGKEEMDTYQPHREQVRSGVKMAIQAALQTIDSLAGEQANEPG